MIKNVNTAFCKYFVYYFSRKSNLRFYSIYTFIYKYLSMLQYLWQQINSHFWLINTMFKKQRVDAAIKTVEQFTIYITHAEILN